LSLLDDLAKYGSLDPIGTGDKIEIAKHAADEAAKNSMAIRNAQTLVKAIGGNRLSARAAKGMFKTGGKLLFWAGAAYTVYNTASEFKDCVE